MNNWGEVWLEFQIDDLTDFEYMRIHVLYGSKSSRLRSKFARICLATVMVSFVSKDTIVPSCGTCLTRHTKGPGGCVILFRMSEYSDFILVNRNIVGPKFLADVTGCLKTRVSDCTSSTVLLNCPPQERPLLLWYKTIFSLQ